MHSGIRLNEHSSIKSRPGQRDSYFGPEVGWLTSVVLGERAALEGKETPGPLIIEEYDTTTVVPLGATATLDQLGNIRFQL